MSNCGKIGFEDRCKDWNKRRSLLKLYDVCFKRLHLFIAF